jgi:hypothetical protein
MVQSGEQGCRKTVGGPVAYEERDTEWGAEVDRGRYIVVCHLAEAGTLNGFMFWHIWRIYPALVAPLKLGVAPQAAGKRLGSKRTGCKLSLTNGTENTMKR